MVIRCKLIVFPLLFVDRSSEYTRQRPFFYPDGMLPMPLDANIPVEGADLFPYMQGTQSEHIDMSSNALNSLCGSYLQPPSDFETMIDPSHSSSPQYLCNEVEMRANDLWAKSKDASCKTLFRDANMGNLWQIDEDRESVNDKPTNEHALPRKRGRPRKHVGEKSHEIAKKKARVHHNAPFVTTNKKQASNDPKKSRNWEGNNRPKISDKYGPIDYEGQNVIHSAAKTQSDYGQHKTPEQASSINQRFQSAVRESESYNSRPMIQGQAYGVKTVALQDVDFRNPQSSPSCTMVESRSIPQIFNYGNQTSHSSESIHRLQPRNESIPISPNFPTLQHFNPYATPFPQHIYPYASSNLITPNYSQPLIQEDKLHYHRPQMNCFSQDQYGSQNYTHPPSMQPPSNSLVMQAIAPRIPAINKHSSIAGPSSVPNYNSRMPMVKTYNQYPSMLIREPLNQYQHIPYQQNQQYLNDGGYYPSEHAPSGYTTQSSSYRHASQVNPQTGNYNFTKVSNTNKAKQNKSKASQSKVGAKSSGESTYFLNKGIQVPQFEVTDSQAFQQFLLNMQKYQPLQTEELSSEQEVLAHQIRISPIFSHVLGLCNHSVRSGMKLPLPEVFSCTKSTKAESLLNVEQAIILLVNNWRQLMDTCISQIESATKEADEYCKSHHIHELFEPELSSHTQAKGVPKPSSKEVKKRGKLPSSATDVLKAWIIQNFDHPYPSDEDKTMLSRLTNIDVTQVTNWFTNIRKRVWQPIVRRFLQKDQSAKRPDTESSERASYPSSLRQDFIAKLQLSANATELLHSNELQKAIQNESKLEIMRIINYTEANYFIYK